MPAHFNDLGIAFLYPDSWQLEQDDASGSVSIESPEGAFLTITQFDAADDAQTILERADAAMQEEYEEVERESTHQWIGEMELRGLVLRFVYLDLIIVSQLMTFTHAGRTYLIQTQAEDREHDRLQAVFAAVQTSLCQHLSR